MMKKLLAFIAALLVLGSVAMAEVTVKDLGDGSVEVTFFYGNPKATEVVIAGSWTDWQNAAEPMTKVEKGWEYKKAFPGDSVLKYKFISDGNWTFDFKAPDKVDDGFGGNNGLVDVAVLVAEAKAAAPGAGEAAAPAAKKANLKFQTWSMFGFQEKFNTVEDMQVESSGVNLKSYWKFGGDALPGVPVYVELALAEQDSFNNLYNRGSLDLEDGAKNMAVDTVFDPLYFYGGQEASKSYLGHFKAGVTTDYVEWMTGYKYAKLTPHTNVSWTTVDKEWEAGYNSVGGFSTFSLGQALRQFGDFTVNATIAPNRSADRAGSQYGIYSFVNVQNGSHYFDFQYNGAYGKTYDTILDEVYEADFIAGYSDKFGPLSVKANALLNRWGANIVNDDYKTAYTPASSDVSNVDEEAEFLANFAGNAQLGYESDLFSVTLGYRNRGYQANMMYVEQGADSHSNISDQLGSLNSQRVWLDVTVNATSAVSLGLHPYVNMTLDQDQASPYNDETNMEIFVKPTINVALKEMTGTDATVDAYVKTKYMTSSDDEFSRGSDTAQFLLPEAGVRVSLGAFGDVLKGSELTYGYDNNDEDQVFHTLIGSFQMPMDVTLQAGGGLRVANADVDASDSPFGLFVGAFKKLPVLAKPTLYTQFVYNMDPFKGFGDGQMNYNFDGYVLDSGVSNYEGAAALRLAMMWDL